jgi:hypothetical protein
MKKKFASSLFFVLKFSVLFALILFADTTNVFAGDVGTATSTSSGASGTVTAGTTDTASSSTKINAKILPSIWYSTLSIDDGESIQIFSGIQNNSGFSFEGTATFYIDDTAVVSKAFSSVDGSLKELSADWIAVPGSHDIQVKISALSLSADKVLSAYESDKSKISVTRKITAEVVKQAIFGTASSIVSGIDSLTSSLANKIESLKIGNLQNASGTSPLSSASSASKLKSASDLTSSSADSQSASSQPADSQAGNGTKSTNDLKKGSVLGTSTSAVSFKGDSKGGASSGIEGPLKYIYNMLLDLLAFLVKNWKWSLGAIVILFLFFKFGNRA